MHPQPLLGSDSPPMTPPPGRPGSHDPGPGLVGHGDVAAGARATPPGQPGDPWASSSNASGKHSAPTIDRFSATSAGHYEQQQQQQQLLLQHQQWQQQAQERQQLQQQQQLQQAQEEPGYVTWNEAIQGDPGARQDGQWQTFSQQGQVSRMQETDAYAHYAQQEARNHKIREARTHFDEVFYEQDSALIRKMKQPERGFLNWKPLKDLYIFCGFERRTPEEMERVNLNGEIKVLRYRRTVASQLLDEVEREVMVIEQLLEEKIARRTRLARAIGSTSYACCNVCGDDDVEDIPPNRTREQQAHGGVVELRSMLRERLEDTELTLAEREKELRDLKHEFGVQGKIRDLQAVAAEDRPHHKATAKDLRERMLRRYAAILDKAEHKDADARLAFIGWKTLVQQQKTAERAMKKGALAFAKAFAKGPLELTFGVWRQHTHEVKARSNKRHEVMMHRYAAKFLNGNDSALVRSAILEWAYLVRDRKASDRLAAALEDAERTAQQRYQGGQAEGPSVVKVSVLSANRLRAADWTGKSDPYCVVEIPGKKRTSFHTEVISSTLDPVWNYVNHEVKEYTDGDDLEFSIWDKDVWPKPDDFLGRATLKATQFFPYGFEGDLQLHDGSDSEKGRTLKATLRVRVDIVASTPAPQSSSHHGKSHLPFGHHGSHHNQEQDYPPDHAASSAAAAQSAADAAARAADAANAAADAANALQRAKAPPSKSCCVVM